MTPNGSLTRFEVQVMITDSINRYDVGNSQRHAENSKKLDRLLWAILGTLATVAGTLALQIVRLSLGK
jgi:hypothetical protein